LFRRQVQGGLKIVWLAERHSSVWHHGCMYPRRIMASPSIMWRHPWFEDSRQTGHSSSSVRVLICQVSAREQKCLEVRDCGLHPGYTANRVCLSLVTEYMCGLPYSTGNGGAPRSGLGGPGCPTRPVRIWSKLEAPPAACPCPCQTLGPVSRRGVEVQGVAGGR